MKPEGTTSEEPYFQKSALESHFFVSYCINMSNGSKIFRDLYRNSNLGFEDTSRENMPFEFFCVEAMFEDFRRILNSPGEWVKI